MADIYKKRKTAFIIGGGDFTGRGLQDPRDLVIAADSGLVPLQELGIRPDVIIGDFDSLGYVPSQSCDSGALADSDGSARKNPDEPELIVLPCVKDDTDTAAACRIAWERGCRELRIYGGSGSRPDHFLANLQLMAFYSMQGGSVSLMAPDFTVYVLTGKSSLSLHCVPGTTFSVFSHNDVSEGVSITGDVKYAIENAALKNSVALGVSNHMTGETAEISVEKGTLLVFVYISPEAAK